MKESIKQFFPMILAALCTLGGIIFLFYGFSNQPQSPFFDISTGFSNITQKNATTNTAEEWNMQENNPFPALVYVGKTLTVGNANSLSDLFVLQTSNNELLPLTSFTDTALYLVDVKNKKGLSLLTTLSTLDIENLEELPSSVIYDSTHKNIYFYQSGTYTLYIRLYYNHRPRVLFECQIPVETR